MSQCEFCQKTTSNPKFCSRSCAASVNNKLHPKRKQKRLRYCTYCGTQLGYMRRKYCNTCRPNNIDWSRVSYKQASGIRKYQKSSRIRDLARALYKKSDKPKHCINCPYDKYYEVCHIKPISEFHEDTPISVINDLDNLAALCPNCHWELDHGTLNIERGNRTPVIHPHTLMT